MLYDYFSSFEKDMIPAKKSAKGTPVKKGTAKGPQKTAGKGKGQSKVAAEKPFNPDMLAEKLQRIIPSNLVISKERPVDSSGFSPEGADFIAYREYCRDLVKIMGGYVPCELVHGTYHVVKNLDRESLYDALKRVVNLKKLDRFSGTPGEEPIIPIPAFIIALESSYNFTDLKNDLINFYINKSIEHSFEMDVLLIMNRGIMVKNWREKRSYIALETSGDTMLSFFILMNEYLEMSREKPLDFRSYTKKDIQYKEY